MRWTFCRSSLFSCWTAVTPRWPRMTAGVWFYKWDSIPPCLSLFSSFSPTGTLLFSSLCRLVAGDVYYTREWRWKLHAFTSDTGFELFERPYSFSVAVILLNGVCPCVSVKIRRWVQFAGAAAESSERRPQCLHHAQHWQPSYAAAKDQCSLSHLQSNTPTTLWVSPAFSFFLKLCLSLKIKTKTKLYVYCA